jgi:hypothetical protein
MTDVKTLFKTYLMEDPLDVYRGADDDLKVSSIELVEERLVDDIPTREIGSANLFLASAFLSTMNGIDLPARSEEELARSKKLWSEMVEELKSEGFIREKPDNLRERFTIV